MAALQHSVGGLPSLLDPPRSFVGALTSHPSAHVSISSAIPDHFFIPSAGLHKGFPAANFTHDQLNAISKPFNWTLIGKFSQGFNKQHPERGRPAVEKLQEYFVALDLKGDFSIGLLDNRHLLIQLQSEEDYLRFYSRMVWYVGSITMRIFKWSPFFHVDRESSIVPIWIALPHLPIQFFDKRSLFPIASLIGCPLRLDAATISLKRPSVARVQIELDLLKSRPHQIWIGMGEKDGFWQKVDYENVPSYCTHCMHVGHCETQCRIHNPELQTTRKELPTQQSRRHEFVEKSRQQSDTALGGQSLSVWPTAGPCGSQEGLVVNVVAQPNTDNGFDAGSLSGILPLTEKTGVSGAVNLETQPGLGSPAAVAAQQPVGAVDLESPDGTPAAEIAHQPHVMGEAPVEDGVVESEATFVVGVAETEAPIVVGAVRSAPEAPVGATETEAPVVDGAAVKKTEGVADVVSTVFVTSPGVEQVGGLPAASVGDAAVPVGEAAVGDFVAAVVAAPSEVGDSDVPAGVSKDVMDVSIAQHNARRNAQCVVPVTTAIRTVLSSIVSAEETQAASVVQALNVSAEEQRELIVMLPPIIPVPSGELSPDEDAGFQILDQVTAVPATSASNVAISVGVSSHPLNVDDASWHPSPTNIARPIPPSFFNVAESSPYHVTYNDNASDEVDDADRDSQEDFLDSQTVRDDAYLEKRKKRRARQERDTVQFRGRGRPLGSRNRTFFDVQRTMCTRSSTID